MRSIYNKEKLKTMSNNREFKIHAYMNKAKPFTLPKTDVKKK